MRHSSTTCKLTIACFDREREDQEKLSIRQKLSRSLKAKTTQSHDGEFNSFLVLSPASEKSLLQRTERAHFNSPLARTEYPSLSETKSDAKFSLLIIQRYTYDVFYPIFPLWVLDIKSRLILLSCILAMSQGRDTAGPLTWCWVASNEIHAMLHRAALTSSVAVTADYRLQSACRQIVFSC